MKVHYLDSSGWIKRYFREAGSERVASLFVEDAALVCSRLGLVEVIAGVVRRARHEGIGEQLIQSQVDNIRQDGAAMVLIDLSLPIISSAEELAARYGLRGADAVHLASVVAYRDAHHDCELVMVASDADLLAAAQRQGIPILDPQRP